MANKYQQQRFEDREDWEPRSSDDWLKKDRLSQSLRKTEGYWGRAEKAAWRVYEAWCRVPPLFRRQIWREREITAAMVEQREVWMKIPGAFSVGVGFRDVGGFRRLCGLVTVEMPVPFKGMDFNDLYEVPRMLKVDSAVPLRTTELEVPIILEHAVPPVQFGVVQPGAFILTSPPPIPPNTPTLQGGDQVAGQNNLGFRTPGTLGCILSPSGNVDPLLLSAGHVFGPVGQTVIAYVPNPMLVAKVLSIDITLDAAVAEPYTPWSLDYRIKGINIVPASPIVPFTDMPVQMYGSSTRHQTGFIDQTNCIPLGGAVSGIVPHFRVEIISAPGDSGALLLSGHGNQPPIPAGRAKHMHQQYLDCLTCAMLGLLVAGPSPQASSLTRARTYFTPILQILECFNLESWVRII